MLRALGPILTGRFVEGMPTPRFVRDFLERHDAEISARRGIACRHVNGSHQVLHVAVWRPGLTVCSMCAASGGLLPDSGVENWTCDVCRRYKPNRISVSVFRTGARLVWFGSCRPCGESLVKTETPFERTANP